MRQHFHIAVAGVVLWLAVDTAIAKEIRLLDCRALICYSSRCVAKSQFHDTV